MAGTHRAAVADGREFSGTRGVARRARRVGPVADRRRSAFRGCAGTRRERVTGTAEVHRPNRQNAGLSNSRALRAAECAARSRAVRIALAASARTAIRACRPCRSALRARHYATGAARVERIGGAGATERELALGMAPYAMGVGTVADDIAARTTRWSRNTRTARRLRCLPGRTSPRAAAVGRTGGAHSRAR